MVKRILLKELRSLIANELEMLATGPERPTPCAWSTARMGEGKKPSGPKRGDTVALDEPLDGVVDIMHRNGVGPRAAKQYPKARGFMYKGIDSVPIEDAIDELGAENASVTKPPGQEHSRAGLGRLEVTVPAGETITLVNYDPGRPPHIDPLADVQWRGYSMSIDLKKLQSLFGVSDRRTDAEKSLETATTGRHGDFEEWCDQVAHGFKMLGGKVKVGGRRIASPKGRHLVLLLGDEARDAHGFKMDPGEYAQELYDEYDGVLSDEPI
jgi:hypothetical protein